MKTYYSKALNKNVTIPEDEPIHTKDSDCTLDETDTCIICGVYHGDPCQECGGSGFHSGDCSYLISGNTLDPLSK